MSQGLDYLDWPREQPGLPLFSSFTLNPMESFQTQRHPRHYFQGHDDEPTCTIRLGGTLLSHRLLHHPWRSSSSSCKC